MKLFRTIWKHLRGGWYLTTYAKADNKQQAVENQHCLIRIGYKAIRTVEVKK